MVEANAQLGLLTLPDSIFGNYRELIRITQYEEMKKVDFGGNDPRLALKMDKISQENQRSRQVYTQLSDGTVPSFEQFQAIKDQLTAKQTTPLTKIEQQKETLRQYLEL